MKSRRIEELMIKFGKVKQGMSGIQDYLQVARII